MDSRRIKILLVPLVIAMMTASAQAQGMGGGNGGRKQHQQDADKAKVQKPKADEKAYNAALKSLPDKPFDPWHGAR